MDVDVWEYFIKLVKYILITVIIVVAVAASVITAFVMSRA